MCWRVGIKGLILKNRDLACMTGGKRIEFICIAWRTCSSEYPDTSGNKRPCVFKANAPVCSRDQDSFYFGNPCMDDILSSMCFILTASSPRSSSTAQSRQLSPHRNCKANVVVGHGAGYAIAHAPWLLGWGRQSILLADTDREEVRQPHFSDTHAERWHQYPPPVTNPPIALPSSDWALWSGVAWAEHSGCCSFA